MKAKIFNGTMIFLFALSLILLHIHIGSNLNNQWDLRRYYYGGVAYASGLNPYDTSVLNNISHGLEVYDFDYPPPSLYFFQFFARFDYSTVYYIFLYGKLLLLLGLIYLWVKIFIPAETDPLFYLFCLVAYTSAFYWDIRSGNLIVLEQVFIWMAFYMFLQRKTIFFCLLILLAAIFKITPILFLFLLWFSKDKKQILYSLVTMAIWGILFLISYFSSPVQFQGFLHNISIIQEHSLYDPCIFPLLKDVRFLLYAEMRIYVPVMIPIMLYFLITLTILFVSWRTMLRLKTKQNKETDKIAVFFFCVVYALILPHFKPYSYMLLIVPTWFILKRIHSRIMYWVILILSIFFACLLNGENKYLYTVLENILISHTIRYIFLIFGYFALFCAYAVWGFYLWAIRRQVLEDSDPSALIP